MPGTIDLTDNRDFRQGVERVGYIGNPATPGKVPWDSRGYEYPQNAERYHEIRRTLNMSFEYTTSTSTNTWLSFLILMRLIHSIPGILIQIVSI